MLHFQWVQPIPRDAATGMASTATALPVFLFLFMNGQIFFKSQANSFFKKVIDIDMIVDMICPSFTACGYPQVICFVKMLPLGITLNEYLGIGMV